MLLSIVLTVAPTEPITAPAVLGRAVHAWALGRITTVDPALARRLHEGSDLRPLTASNLWGTGRAQDGRVSLDPEHPCWLRVTTLTEETSRAFEQGLPPPGETLTLGDARLVVREVATDARQHPWAGRASYTDLVQRYTLAAGATPRSVTLRFASPTLFRSHDRDCPLPLPEMVFGSYLHKWNSFSPLTLPEEALRYASECVALGRFRLCSRLVSFEQGGKGAQVGFTGEAHFRFLVSDAYWTRLMCLLAGYAFWCGTGYRTTVGLGQTQMVEGWSASGKE